MKLLMTVTSLLLSANVFAELATIRCQEKFPGPNFNMIYVFVLDEANNRVLVGEGRIPLRAQFTESTIVWQDPPATSYSEPSITMIDRVRGTIGSWLGSSQFSGGLCYTQQMPVRKF